MSKQETSDSDKTTTTSFPIAAGDALKAGIIDQKPPPSSSFEVVVEGRSISGSTRKDLTQVCISGVKLPSMPPSSSRGE